MVVQFSEDSCEIDGCVATAAPFINEVEISNITLFKIFFACFRFNPEINTERNCYLHGDSHAGGCDDSYPLKSLADRLNYIRAKPRGRCRLFFTEVRFIPKERSRDLTEH